MKIQGIVTGIIRDATTGEIKRTFEEKNTVTEGFLSEMCQFSSGGGSNNRRFGQNIFISSKNYPATSRWEHQIFEVLAIGYVESGITSPRNMEDLPTNNTGGPYGYYMEFQQRFGPPASTRTIRVVGLTHNTSAESDYINYQRVHAQAWVRLTTDCIQETTETLDIFYRIQFLSTYDGRTVATRPPVDATGLPLEDTYIVYRRHGADGWDGQYFKAANLTWHGHKLNVKGISHSFHAYGADVSATGLGVSAITGLRKSNITNSAGINDGLGRIIGAIAYGESGGWRACRFHKHITRPGTSPIQNIFGHTAPATKPFYDSTTAQTGTGLISIDGSSWTDPDYPKLYRIEITNSGGVGTATYKFRVRNSFGFTNNTFDDASRSVIPMDRYNGNAFAAGFAFGFDNASDTNAAPTIVKYDSKTIVAAYYNDVLVMDITTGDSKRFHNTTTPALGATLISQYVVDTAGNIWIACRNTGLYKINSTLTTVTKIDNTTSGLTGLTQNKCYGIVQGVGNRLWTVFDGGLFRSDDGGASWTSAAVTFTTITNNWSLVKFIKADRTHVDHRLAFAYDAGGGNLNISWWNLTTSTNVAGPTINNFNTGSGGYTNIGGIRVYWDRPVTYFKCLECSPTQGMWGCGGRRTNYGNTYAYPAKFDFNTTNVYQPTFTYGTGSFQHTAFGIDNDGNESLWVLGDDGTGVATGWVKPNNTITVVSTARASGGEERTYIGHNAMEYMGNSTWIGMKPYYQYSSTTQHQHHRIVTLGDPGNALGGILQNELWTSYGWDGSQWARGHVDSKTLHNTPELLHDGITITFNDEGGTRNYVNTEYYTVGVVDGVWLDGATAYSHKASLYYKPTIEGETDIEAPILPAIQRTPNSYEWRSSFTWQNAAGVTSNTETAYRNSQANNFNSGVRSVEPLRRTDTAMDPIFESNVGRIEFRHFSQSGFENTTYPNKVLVGLSDSSVIGTPISYNSPQFALLIDGSTHLGSYNATLYAVFSGVTVQTLRIVNTNYNENDQYYRIWILDDGSVRYDYFQTNEGWNILWQSAPGVAPTDRNYYIDSAFSGTTNSGFEVMRMKTQYPNDYYTMFGNSTNQTGRWRPNFFAIDYDHNFEVKIDGVTATQIAIDNYTTTLSAGQISVHPSTGMIRYSAADTGKTMTARYTTIVHE